MTAVWQCAFVESSAPGPESPARSGGSPSWRDAVEQSKVDRMPAAARNAVLLAMIPALAVATVWLVGDMSETDHHDYDIMVEPLSLSSGTWMALGLLSTAVTLVGAVVAVRSYRSGGRARAAVLVTLPMLGLAVYSGITYRVLTARVVGANIGGGMLLLLGVVLVPTLVIASGVIAWRTRSR